MTPQEIIRKLFELGYLWCPEALAVTSGPPIAEADLKNLTLQNKIVTEGARRYQENFKADLSQFTMRYHLRQSNADGDVGPATQDLMQIPRCGVPDYRHPMARSLEGNWPGSCRMNITTSYQLNLQGVSAEETKALWLEALQTWMSVIEIGLKLELDKYPNTSVYASQEPMSGGILAWMELARNSCSHLLQGKYNSNVTWNLLLLLTTIIHELGHAWGLPHVTRDPEATMFPSINQGAMRRRGKPNRSDVAMAVSVGYKERTTPIPDPDPQPDPDQPRRHILRIESASPIFPFPE